MIRKTIFLIFLFLFSTIVFAQERFFWKCPKKDECNLYAILDNGTNVLVLDKLTEDMAGKTGFTYYKNNFGEATVSCGSYCNGNIFVDFETGKISNLFSDILAINQTEKVIFTTDFKSESSDDFLIYPLFSKNNPGIKVSVPYVGMPVETALDATFLKNGDLKITYDAEYINNDPEKPIVKDKIIHIDYEKLK